MVGHVFHQPGQISAARLGLIRGTDYISLVGDQLFYGVVSSGDPAAAGLGALVHRVDFGLGRDQITVKMLGDHASGEAVFELSLDGSDLSGGQEGLALFQTVIQVGIESHQCLGRGIMSQGICCQ